MSRSFNSTIRCKKRPCKTCHKPSYIFSHGNCQSCSIKERVLRQDEEDRDEFEAESWTNLRDDCDSVLSLYIRHRYADRDGNVKCYTCHKVLPISQMTNGHYISRSNMSLRHSEHNCRVQCQSCNSNHETDTKPFKDALEREKNGLSEWLEEQGREVFKPSISDLKETLSNLKYKYSLVKKKI